MPRTLAGLPVVGYESITGSASAQSLTKAKYDTATPPRGAMVYVDSAPIRYRTDGTAPTASEGIFLIPTADPIILTGPDLVTFQFINQGASNAVVRVQYLGTS